MYDAAGETLTPASIYGVYKIANEGSARIYWQESQVASVGLRPLIVYGGGRDQGTTSSPTLAMAAAARGEAVPDPLRGEHPVAVRRRRGPGFHRRRPPARTRGRGLQPGRPRRDRGRDRGRIEQAAPGAQVTFDDVALPFASRLPEPWFEMAVTPLAEGVAATVELYRRASRPRPFPSTERDDHGRTARRDQAGDPVKGVLPDVIAWLGEGHPVALARVVEVVGSGVQPAGAAWPSTPTGQVAGSASGGCVEGALVEQTRAALSDDGRPRLATFGCTDDEAFDVGLTCGGMVRVLIERLEPPVPWLDALARVLVAGTGAALVEVVDGPADSSGRRSWWARTAR